MPNWCSTYIDISNENHQELINFYNLMSDWVNKDAGLTEILKNSGAVDDMYDAELPYSRGRIEELNLYEDPFYFKDPIININAETAWEPALEAWRLLLFKLLPGAHVIYSAEEWDKELFETNNPEFIGKYIVDYDGIVRDYTKDEVVRLLQRYLNTTESDIHTLLNMLDACENENRPYVNSWEYVEF